MCYVPMFVSDNEVWVQLFFRELMQQNMMDVKCSELCSHYQVSF
jgi:hypothetical protein